MYLFAKEAGALKPLGGSNPPASVNKIALLGAFLFVESFLKGKIFRRKMSGCESRSATARGGGSTKNSAEFYGRPNPLASLSNKAITEEPASYMNHLFR
jgi:hypothetical protein